MIQLRALITGRVQGVWYRQSTLEQARALGLAGWVRNTPAGEVEALFEGEADAVEAMVQWCHSGPPMAKVGDVATERFSPQGLLPPFKIRHN